MTAIDEQVARFREDFYSLTRVRPKGFVCPITLEDVSLDRLCAGHILNDALYAASLQKIVQFVDVDNFYGTAIESELVAFLNFPVMSAEERLKTFKRFFISLDGERYEVFPASKEAAVRFPRIELFNPEGKLIGERYVKSERIEPAYHTAVETQFFLEVHDFGITGALLKSAYLALFRLVGYRYGLDAVGSTVQRALAEFFRQHASRANAKDHFGRFQGAAIVSLGGMLDTIPDTLEGGRILTHYAEGTPATGILFAVSCLFRVNGCTLIVTLPAYSKYGYGLDALEYYRSLLADRAMKHSIQLTRFHGNWYEMTPLETRHISSTTIAA